LNEAQERRAEASWWNDVIAKLGGASLDWYVGGAGFSGSQHPVWPVVAGTVLPFKILD
jgi:hypothetical protein